MFVNRIAMSWTAQRDRAPASAEDRDLFMEARRTALLAAVQRRFPAVSDTTPARA